MMGLRDGQRTRRYPATREPAYRPPPRPLSRSSSRNIASHCTSPVVARCGGGGSHSDAQAGDRDTAGGGWDMRAKGARRSRDSPASQGAPAPPGLPFIFERGDSGDGIGLLFRDREHGEHSGHENPYDEGQVESGNWYLFGALCFERPSVKM